MLARVKIFFDMIKFEHSLFALPFAYSGLMMAEGGWPRAGLFGGVTIAMVSLRSMAMGANRLIDRHLDALNPRTLTRALPSGRLSVKWVIILTLFFLLLFFLSAYSLGPLCFLLSPIPVLLAWIYPFTKRFTWFSHGVLGTILGIAPVGAWLAGRSEFSPVPIFLGLGVAGWVAGFDILYALQDIDFDRRFGLYSVPARWGIDAGLNCAQWLHIMAFVAWGVVGWLSSFGAFYTAGMVVVAFFLIRQHWLVRRLGFGMIEKIFFEANAVVSAGLFLAIGLELGIRGHG